MSTKKLRATSKHGTKWKSLLLVSLLLSCTSASYTLSNEYNKWFSKESTTNVFLYTTCEEGIHVALSNNENGMVLAGSSKSNRFIFNDPEFPNNDCTDSIPFLAL